MYIAVGILILFHMVCSVCNILFFSSGKNTGEVLTEPTEPQNPNPIRIVWSSQKKLYEIDWFALWYELKNWELPWQYMNFSEILKPFLIALIQFFFCNYDMITDGQVTYKFFNGANYEYYFLNDTDPTINRLNCTFLKYHKTLNSGVYAFSCFSQEKILGFISMIIMILPGIFLSCLIAYGLRKTPVWMWISIMISQIVSVTFPVLLFLIKVNTILEKHSFHAFNAVIIASFTK